MTDASPTPIRGTECDECEDTFLFRRHSIPDRCPACREDDGGEQRGLLDREWSS